jgi:LytS/YehU family sensor histidine kinase
LQRASDISEDSHLITVVLFTLLPTVVAFSFIVFVFYRARRESYFKQKEAELKLSISEVEMKALRSQINPHFIFNCLNSIHHYMHGNDLRLAGEYLVKFSQLIRHVLETSHSRMITLGDDLEALRLYIQLEQLRLNHSFDFTITTDDFSDLEAVHVPPMLIQPFVENSIWHGLNHRGTGGVINIRLARSGEMLKCTIEDNGFEKKEPAINDLSLMVKKTSLGMSLINERLEVVNSLYKVQAGFTMNDVVDEENKKCGKKVELLLPYEE